jgi:hypothetical protein
MRHHLAVLSLVVVLMLISACGTTVQPGQRGLRASDRGLIVSALEKRVLLACAVERCVRV